MHKYTTDELVSQKPSPSEFKKLNRRPLVFILHNIRSLQNVGLFFRLADAFLIEKIYLTGYTGFPKKQMDSREQRVIDHAEREINKTAIKLVPFVPWEQTEEILPLLDKLRTNSYQLIAVEQTDSSVDYRKQKYHDRVALIFGHERTGIENDLLETCDSVIEIPMHGMGNSHNVATSAAIVTSFIQNQSLKGLVDSG